jgi:hypothetical protein
MKQPNSQKTGVHSKSIKPSALSVLSMVPSVTVEIIGADDKARDAIETAIICALQNIAPSEAITVDRKYQ